MLGNPLRDLTGRSIRTHFHQISTTNMSHYVWEPASRPDWPQHNDKFSSNFYYQNVVLRVGTRKRQLKITIFRQFLTMELHFVRKGRAGQLKIAIFFNRQNHNFSSIFDDRTSFRAELSRFRDRSWPPIPP